MTAGTARRATAATALALVAVTACSPGRSRPPVVERTAFLDKLSSAVDGVNAARQALADDAAALATAAKRLDDVDAVAVTGDRSGVRARRPAAGSAAGKAATAARKLGKDVAAYDKAATALSGATGEGLDAAQRAAVDSVAAAARDELGQLHAYATVIATIWPRYEELDGDEALWLARSSNGWYRDQDEAANAYVALTDRTGLAAARTSLSNADAARLRAARRASAVIRTARAALAALLG